MSGSLNAEQFPITRGLGEIKFNPKYTPKSKEPNQTVVGTKPVRAKPLNVDVQLKNYIQDLNKLRNKQLDKLVKDPINNSEIGSITQEISSLNAAYMAKLDSTSIIISEEDKRRYIFTINLLTEKYTTAIQTIVTAVHSYINNNDDEYTAAKLKMDTLFHDKYIDDTEFLNEFRKYIKQFDSLRKQKAEEMKSKKRNNNAAAEQTRQNQTKKDAMLQLRGELNASINGKNTNTHTATLLNELKELIKKSLVLLVESKNNSNTISSLTKRVNTNIDVLQTKYFLLITETGLNKNSSDYKAKVIRLCEKYKQLWNYVLESINAFKKDDPVAYKTLHTQMFDIDPDVAKIIQDKYRQEFSYAQFRNTKNQLTPIPIDPKSKLKPGPMSITQLEKQRNNITQKMIKNEYNKNVAEAAAAAAATAKKAKNDANRLKTEEAERVAEEARKAEEEAQKVAEEAAKENELVSDISGRNTTLSNIKVNTPNNTSAANKLKRRNEYNKKAAAAKKNAENKRLAATKLQALYKGHKTRKHLKAAQNAKNAAKKAQENAEAAQKKAEKAAAAVVPGTNNGSVNTSGNGNAAAAASGNGIQPSENTSKNCIGSNMNNPDITKWHMVKDLTDENEDVYYVNKMTGELSWEVPEKGCIDPNSKWKKTKNDDSTWYESVTGKESVWELPTNETISSANTPESPPANQSISGNGNAAAVASSTTKGIGSDPMANRRKRVQAIMGTTPGSNTSDQGPSKSSPSNAVTNWNGSNNNENNNNASNSLRKMFGNTTEYENNLSASGTGKSLPAASSTTKGIGSDPMTNRRTRVQAMMGTTSGSKTSGQGPSIPSPSNVVPNWNGSNNNSEYENNLSASGTRKSLPAAAASGTAAAAATAPQGGPGFPSGRFAQIYRNIANVRTDLNRFNATLKKPPQSKPQNKPQSKPQTPTTKVNMNQLRELQEGMNNPPNNKTNKQSNFNKMTSKLEELKKGRGQTNSSNVNMNQLKELQEGLSQTNPPNVNMNQLKELQNDSINNEMKRKLNDLKKGRRQSRKNRSNKSRKNRNTRRKRRN